MQSLSHVWLFVTLGTVAHQAPLSRILQARILEWAAMSFSRGFFLPRVWTHLSCVSYTVGRFFTLWVTGGAQSRENQKIYIISPNNVKKWRIKKEHKVDGTTIKHSIRRPPQAPRNGMHSRNELTPNRPDAGWAQGKKVEASWQAAYLLHEPWLHGHAEFPRRCSCPSLSFLPLSMPLFHSILRASPQNFQDNWIFKMYYLFFKTHTKKKLKKSKS